MIDPLTILVERAVSYAAAHDAFLLSLAALVTVALLTWLSFPPRPIVRTIRVRN